MFIKQCIYCPNYCNDFVKLSWLRANDNSWSSWARDRKVSAFGGDGDLSIGCSGWDLGDLGFGCQKGEVFKLFLAIALSNPPREV